MSGSVFIVLLVAVCLAEGLAKGYPRRAALLKNLRILVVVGWVAWAVLDNWNNLTPINGLVFDDLVAVRLFLVASFSAFVMLVLSSLQRPRRDSLLTFLITVNAVVWATYGLVLGATISWSASTPYGLGFVVVTFVMFAITIWGLASTATRNLPHHASAYEVESPAR